MPTVDDVFSPAWCRTFRARIAALRSARMLASSHRAWSALVLHGPLREPHIEWFDDEVRFTWHRAGHHLDFGVFVDGRVAWFYSAAGRPTQHGRGEALPPAFHALLRYARPDGVAVG